MCNLVKAPSSFMSGKPSVPVSSRVSSINRHVKLVRCGTTCQACWCAVRLSAATAQFVRKSPRILNETGCPENVSPPASKDVDFRLHCSDMLRPGTCPHHVICRHTSQMCSALCAPVARCSSGPRTPVNHDGCTWSNHLLVVSISKSACKCMTQIRQQMEAALKDICVISLSRHND